MPIGLGKPLEAWPLSSHWASVCRSSPGSGFFERAEVSLVLQTLDVGISASIKPQTHFFPAVIVSVLPPGFVSVEFSVWWLELKTKHCVLANCSVKHVVSSYHLQWSSLSGSIIFLGSHFTESPVSLVPE